MKKLIDYLYEYEGVQNWYATMTNHSMKRELKCCYMLDESKDVIETWIVSKVFGFIKWLVENKKIDFRKVKEKTGLERELYERMLYWYKETDFLIMLLSVEDEPIKFLISLLK